MGKLVFDQVKGKKKFDFLFFLASNKSNKPRGAGLQNVCKQNVCAHFRVTVKIFRGPASS